MTTRAYVHRDVRTVATRPVKARAMQFLYQDGSDATLRHTEWIMARLGVTIRCASDQGALFCHLELDRNNSPILKNGDWVLVDSFGKIQIVKQAEFPVYYEPES